MNYKGNKNKAYVKICDPIIFKYKEYNNDKFELTILDDNNRKKEKEKKCDQNYKSL